MVVHEWSLHLMLPRSPNPPPPNPPTKQMDQEGISTMADLFLLIQQMFCNMKKTSFREK